MGRRENFQKRKRNEWNETKQKKRNETNDGWRHLRGGASRPSRRFPRSFVSFRFFRFVSFHSFRFRFWKFSLHMARPNLIRFYIRFNFLQPFVFNVFGHAAHQHAWNPVILEVGLAGSGVSTSLASTVRVFLIAQDDRGVKNIFYRQKKSRSDFFWRRPLGCVLKETYAEGGKKRLVTCVDKESFLFEQKAVCTKSCMYIEWALGYFLTVLATAH